MPAPAYREETIMRSGLKHEVRNRMLPKNILVPTDLGEGAEEALDYACELAAQFGATIHLLNVISIPALGVPELGVAMTSTVIDSLIAGQQGRARRARATQVREGDDRPALLRTGDARDVIINAGEGARRRPDRDGDPRPARRRARAARQRRRDRRPQRALPGPDRSCARDRDPRRRVSSSLREHDRCRHWGCDGDDRTAAGPHGFRTARRARHRRRAVLEAFGASRARSSSIRCSSATPTTTAPLPIGYGQTISQPYVVAMTVEALALQGHERVLEIGTGSGYAAAILGVLAARGRHDRAHPRARRDRERATRTAGPRERPRPLRRRHARLAPNAPYEAICVAAGAPRPPPPLLDQLAIGGRLVLPFGDASRAAARPHHPTRREDVRRRESRRGAVRAARRCRWLAGRTTHLADQLSRA